MMALVSVKTGRDAAFLTTSELEDLPFGYLLIALASIPGSMLHVNAMRRWGTRGARVRLLVLITAMFAFFVAFVDTHSPTTYSWMGLASMLGGISGGAVR